MVYVMCSPEDNPGFYESGNSHQLSLSTSGPCLLSVAIWGASTSFHLLESGQRTRSAMEMRLDCDR